MLDRTIEILLTNFSFAMVVLAVFFMIINRLVTKGRVSKYEIIYRWLALFCLGFTGIYTFFMHAYFPVLAAAAVGWSDSPFQFEVAVADLSFGVLGLLSFRASIGFRLATVLGSTIWLWGDAVGHIYQITKFNNYATGNSGTWFWMDIIVPLILVICVTKLKHTVTTRPGITHTLR